LNFAFSAILFAVGSHRQASRLLAGGLAAYAALIAVHLLTFLSPFRVAIPSDHWWRSNMKLARITKPIRSLQVRVTLAGDLNAALESYARYYEHVHGDPVDSRR
jgi:hypothetical protein